VLQAGLLTYAGFRGSLPPARKSPFRTAAGITLVFYAAVAYPVIGLLVHGYPEVALFGVTPCPVTIFTLGCFLLDQKALPWWTLVIPALWSLIGGSAAILLNVPQDWFLLGTGPLVVILEARSRPANAEI